MPSVKLPEMFSEAQSEINAELQLRLETQWAQKPSKSDLPFYLTYPLGVEACCRLRHGYEST